MESWIIMDFSMHCHVYSMAVLGWVFCRSLQMSMFSGFMVSLDELL
jgi:hypothetical protein